MGRRLGALAVAVVMVVAAVVIRAHIDDNSGSGSGSSGSGAGPVSLTCASELEPACTAILRADGDVRVIIEPAGVTASRLEAADAVTGIDGWLVEAPWPQIVDQARARNGLPGLFEADPPVLARSPLVMAMWNDRLDAIIGSCTDGALTWKCVGDVAGKQWSTIGGEESWNEVKPGFADPRTDGVGALVLAQAAVSFFGTTDLSSDQFNDDDSQRWIHQMATAVPQNPTFADMLTFGPSAVDVVGTTEAEAGPGLESSRDKGNITITYPAPVATADVVLAQVARASGGGRLARIVGGETGLDALAAAAWRVPNHPTPAGVNTEVELPADSGLPSPGAIDALRQVWKDAQ
jgi:hypothetical protein